MTMMGIAGIVQVYTTVPGGSITASTHIWMDDTIILLNVYIVKVLIGITGMAINTL